MIGGLLVLAAVFVVFFTDWFRPKFIGVFHTNRLVRVRTKDTFSMMPQLIFGLDRQVKLTEITVVPLAEYETNRRVLPTWHVISDSNSVPVKTFTYGQRLRGMRPVVVGSHPQTLASNVTYRIFVEAGETKGQHDFKID